MFRQRFFINTSFFSSIKDFVLLNLGIASILMLLYCPSCFLTISGLRSLIPDFIFSFLMSFALSLGGFKVEEFFDKRISWIEYPVKRLLLTATTYMVYSFIISFVLITAFVLITVDEVNFQNISWIRMLKNTGTPILVALIIISIFISRSWLFEWRKAAIEAEQLKTEMFASRYQSLKDQLNPHFLFNSLNVLSNLVYENADKSAAFIQQLSKIYRYVLDVQQEQLVSLQQELDFAENYLSLQKIRFDESLLFNISVPKPEKNYLPPLSLQLLLENAIKHNVISMEQPLRIRIEQQGKKLIISNNLQQKDSSEKRERGIGLENIEKRYALLSDQVPKILNTATEFRVELPLLTISESTAKKNIS